MSEHDKPEPDGDDAYERAYEAHREAIYDQLIAYAEEHDLSDGFIADLTSDLGLSLRMVAYVTETDKPSVIGLRMELDRYARDMGESVRDAKKHAAEFLASTQEEEEPAPESPVKN